MVVNGRALVQSNQNLAGDSRDILPIYTPAKGAKIESVNTSMDRLNGEVSNEDHKESHEIQKSFFHQNLEEATKS